MNKVLVVGRLGQAIELKGNDKVSWTRFSVACDHGKDKDGNKLTDWVPVVAFNQSAEYLDQYAEKGDRVEVEGRVTTSSYEKDGETRYYTEVTADRVSILFEKKAEDKKPVKKSYRK